MKATKNNNNLRSYYAADIMVSIDGVVYEDDGKTIISQTLDNLGNPVVNVNGCSIRVEVIVATCFGYRPNEDSKDYIIHKDRNMANCKASNLRWATRDEYLQHYGSYPSTEDEEIAKWRPALCGGRLMVSRDGQVMKDGKPVDILNSMYDSDTDSDYAMRPYVYCYKKNKSGGESRIRFFVEDMVAKRYLPPQPNYTQLIHIDGNYMDCSADNLKYVLFSDPACSDYNNKMRAEIDKLNAIYRAKKP